MWPFCSLIVAITVYVCPLTGLNAGTNDTDWSGPSGTTGWPVADDLGAVHDAIGDAEAAIRPRA